jgi:hypothetical protein
MRIRGRVLFIVILLFAFVVALSPAVAKAAA